MKPAETLDGMPAILDVPAGRGHVLLFAFNPMHRYLTHSDFRFVYNALLNWDDLEGRPWCPVGPGSVGVRSRGRPAQRQPPCPGMPLGPGAHPARFAQLFLK